MHFHHFLNETLFKLYGWKIIWPFLQNRLQNKHKLFLSREVYLFLNVHFSQDICNRLYECVHVYKELEMQSVHFWSNAVNA